MCHARALQVVHRKLTVSDSGLKTARSIDGAMDKMEGSSSGGVEQQEAGRAGEEDRRASTGEMSVPATLTSLSPLPLRDEGENSKQSICPKDKHFWHAQLSQIYNADATVTYMSMTFVCSVCMYIYIV